MLGALDYGVPHGVWKSMVCIAHLLFLRASHFVSSVNGCLVKGNTMGVTKLYHHSHASNRESIIQNGLLTKYDQTNELGQPGVVGAIYLTTAPKTQQWIDCWAVDVTGLELTLDNTQPDRPEFPHEVWYMCFEDIPPNRLRLYRQAASY